MAGRDDLDRALDDGRGPDDDDRDELDDDGLDDDGDEAGAGDGADWKPPTKEEWEAHQAKLTRARRQAQRLRQERDGQGGRSGDRSRRPSGQGGTQGGHRSASRRREADDVDAELDRREQEAESRAERDRWETRAIRGDARAALLARGASSDLVDLAIAKIKPSDIEYDDDDEPMLDDWLDRMEERYPRLFRQRRAAGQREERGESSNGAGRRPGSLDQGSGSGRASSDTGGGRRADESYGAYMMRVSREADGLQQRGRRR